MHACMHVNVTILQYFIEPFSTISVCGKPINLKHETYKNQKIKTKTIKTKAINILAAVQYDQVCNLNTVYHYHVFRQYFPFRLSREYLQVHEIKRSQSLIICSSSCWYMHNACCITISTCSKINVHYAYNMLSTHKYNYNQIINKIHPKTITHRNWVKLTTHTAHANWIKWERSQIHNTTPNTRLAV